MIPLRKPKLQDVFDKAIIDSSEDVSKIAEITHVLLHVSFQGIPPGLYRFHGNRTLTNRDDVLVGRIQNPRELGKAVFRNEARTLKHQKTFDGLVESGLIIDNRLKEEENE